MYFVYRIFTNLIILISPIIILLRLIKKKEELLSVSEKFCIYSKKNSLKSIWFHAASVGELMSILPKIKSGFFHSVNFFTVLLRWAIG